METFLFNFLLALFYRISLKLSCPMDFTNFPMDKQTCAIRMASCKYAQSLSLYFCYFFQPTPSGARCNWRQVRVWPPHVEDPSVRPLHQCTTHSCSLFYALSVLGRTWIVLFLRCPFTELFVSFEWILFIWATHQSAPTNSQLKWLKVLYLLLVWGGSVFFSFIFTLFATTFSMSWESFLDLVFNDVFTLHATGKLMQSSAFTVLSADDLCTTCIWYRQSATCMRSSFCLDIKLGMRSCSKSIIKRLGAWNRENHKQPGVGNCVVHPL